MTALDQLAEHIETAAGLGLIPETWAELVRRAQDEIADDWLPEDAFRARTGSSAEWCRRNFARVADAGLAKRVNGKRHWHSHARLPRPQRSLDAIRTEVANDLRSAS